MGMLSPHRESLVCRAARLCIESQDSFSNVPHHFSTPNSPVGSPQDNWTDGRGSLLQPLHYGDLSECVRLIAVSARVGQAALSDVHAARWARNATPLLFGHGVLS